MMFPELAFTTRGTKGASGQGGLWFDFRALGAARAVHLRCESGHIFGIEFADVDGVTIHRFTATKASNLDNFLGWVRLHQACSGRGSAAGEPGHARIDRRVNGRAPRLQFHSHPVAPEPALVLELSDETQAVTWCELLQGIA